MSKIYDKTAANFKATTVDAKIIDAQKILVRPKGGDIDERVNILDVVGGLDLDQIGDERTFDTNETTYTGETEGVSIQLDKSDFIPGNVYLKEVSLPYIQGLNTEARYCHVLFFNGGEQIAKITSLDTQTRQTGNNTLLKSTWNYKTVLIPDYEFVRIVLSSSATLPVTGTDDINCSVFRINVCRNQNNQNINPTNLSKLYNSNGTTQAFRGWVEVKYALSQMDELKEQIEAVSNELNTAYTQDKNRYYSEYSTRIFQDGVENVEKVYTSSVRFGSTHMPSGFIKKVSFYGRDADSATHDSKTNGCYLIAKIYKKATGELVRSYTSTNGKVKVLEKQSGSSERPLNTWEFDGFESIAEDEIIKFIPSSDGKTQSSTYYFGVAVDNTHTHDDCQVGGDGDANNPLAPGVKNLALAVFEGFFYNDLKNEGLKEYEKNFLQTLYTTTTKPVFDNNIDNLADENIGVGNVRGFILERPYISNCSFNEIRWVSKGTLSSTTRLKATLRDRRGKRLQSYVSDNEENFGMEGLKSFRFVKDIEVTDDIGSIIFETCDAAGVITTSQIRVRVIGNATNDNAGGSEVTNNNFIIHVVFHGKVATGNDNILSKTTADTIYATKADYDELLTGNVKTTASQQTTVAWDACRVPSEYIMHTPFSTITMTALSDNTDTPVHLGVVAFDGTNRTKLGVSSVAKTWSNGDELIWQFDNDIIIPRNQSIELYLTLSKEAFEQSLDSCGVTITTGAHGSIQSGNYRENNTWYSPRIITFTMTGVSHFTDSSKHLSKEDKAALEQVVQGSLVSKDELGESLGALSLALSLTAEEKAALQQVIHKGSLISKDELDESLGALSIALSLSLEEKAALEKVIQGYFISKEESDARYSQLHSENTLTETNTFEKTIVAQDGVHASSGDIVVSDGVITFEDLIDGTVIERSGASGYQYVEGMPSSFENGVCYDIGEISNTTDLSNVKFTAEGRLVQTCELWFTTSTNPPTAHQWPTGIYWIDSATGAAPTLLASKNYRLVFRREPNKIIASIAYLY